MICTHIANLKALPYPGGLSSFYPAIANPTSFPLFSFNRLINGGPYQH